MALIKCKECQKEISDKAKVCPHCGCPILSEEEQKNIQLSKELYNDLMNNDVLDVAKLVGYDENKIYNEYEIQQLNQRLKDYAEAKTINNTSNNTNIGRIILGVIIAIVGLILMLNGTSKLL